MASDKATEQQQQQTPANDESMLLSADPSKYVTLPVEYEDIWLMYQATLDSFWTVNDIYLAKDSVDFASKFSVDEREFLLKLLGFLFTYHQTVINKELFMKFINNTDIKEATYYFGSQADIKKTHRVMYSMLIDELLGDNIQKRDELIVDTLSMPSMRDMLKWSIKSTTMESKTFAERLLSFACLQGILLAGPFATIGWIKVKRAGLTPGLCSSNDLISRDEQLNCSFSCLLYKYVEDELSEDRAHEIVQEITSMATVFMTKTLPVSIIGINCVLMRQYIEFAADRLLVDLGYSKVSYSDLEPQIDSKQTTNAMCSKLIMSLPFLPCYRYTTKRIHSISWMMPPTARIRSCSTPRSPIKTVMPL